MMNVEQTREFYRKVHVKWGRDLQLLIAVEEMSELQKDIIKVLRGFNRATAEEIADVEIMLEQLKIIFDNSKAVEEIKQDKLNKLKIKLEQEST